ncbi:MAG TPA: hypothetical protein VKA94_16595 [Hyphomicrobiales bacterium]|nr:hypothetical protein [Hyphomicrobiales bacterium]
MKVVLCTPTVDRPRQACLDAVEGSVPALDAAGIEHSIVYKIGWPYISHARAEMLRQAMSTDADAVVFIDHDLSWRPEDIVALIQTEGDVVAGTYRFKKPDVEYMGTWMCHGDGRPMVRESDGALRADCVPAGFLKITRDAVRKFMRAYPELTYGDPVCPSIDLFNHGAWEGVWWGEDYAFCRRWKGCGGEVWLVPDMNITHHGQSDEDIFPGNLHEWLQCLPGGSNYDPET